MRSVSKLNATGFGCYPHGVPDGTQKPYDFDATHMAFLTERKNNMISIATYMAFLTERKNNMISIATHMAFLTERKNNLISMLPTWRS